MKYKKLKKYKMIKYNNQKRVRVCYMINKIQYKIKIKYQINN